jgi:diamine N-acetyltransferase
VEKLTGQKIRLRAVEPEDLEWLFRWENSTEIWQVSNTLVPFSRYVLHEYLKTAQLDIFENKQLRLMIDSIDDNQTIGTVDLFDFDPQNQRAGIGILIADSTNRGKGFAADSLSVIVRYAFDTLLLHQLYCNIGESNSKSLKLFEEAGFVRAGIKKSWVRTKTGWEDEFFLQLVNKTQN